MIEKMGRAMNFADTQDEIASVERTETSTHAVEVLNHDGQDRGDRSQPGGRGFYQTGEDSRSSKLDMSSSEYLIVGKE